MKVTFRGFTFDTRTVAMIRWAEKRARFRFTIAQGSYNTGGVAASAGTHDGGGAVDFSVRDIDAEQRVIMLRALKDAGFAAWYRKPRAGVWGAHIHAVAIGCKDLAPLARRQVEAFDDGRDGLAGNGPDKTYRPDPKVQFSLPLNRPIKRK